MWNPEKVSNIKPFINKRNGINYPFKIYDWKTFGKNNLTIALNILYINEKEDWHYLTAKKLFTALRGITSKHHGHFYCLNSFFILLEQKINLNLMKKYVKIKIFEEL